MVRRYSSRDIQGYNCSDRERKGSKSHQGSFETRDKRGVSDPSRIPFFFVKGVSCTTGASALRGALRLSRFSCGPHEYSENILFFLYCSPLQIEADGRPPRTRTYLSEATRNERMVSTIDYQTISAAYTLHASAHFGSIQPLQSWVSLFYFVDSSPYHTYL